jgi:hypothetical protein
MKKLSDLKEGNKYFEMSKKGLEQKLKIVATFLDRNEFINAEIERAIPDPPMIVQVKDGERILDVLSFDFGKYSRLAFDWLSHGDDPTIEEIINMAKREYAKTFKNDPQSIEYANNSRDFEDTIIAMLSQGVGDLLYKKHLREIKALPPQDDDAKNLIDPLSLIDPAFKGLFLKAEKKATENTLKFDTAIRCAAFCEFLYDIKKYISPTKTRQKTMVSFAKNRYDIDISKALATSKKEDREKNINKTIKKMQPLIRCFSGT